MLTLDYFLGIKNKHCRRVTKKIDKPTRSDLTCVSKFLVSAHGEDHQEVPQYINHDSEDQKAAQSCADPGRAIQRDLVRAQCRTVHQPAAIYVHFIFTSVILAINHRI